MTQRSEFEYAEFYTVYPNGDRVWQGRPEGSRETGEETGALPGCCWSTAAGSAVRSGLLQEIQEELDRDRQCICEELGGVQPNPRLALAREGVEKAIAFQADLILAVGGGSVIDTAKAVAVGAYVPGTDIWDIWMGKAPLTGALPVGAVLTISAAGSETSDSAVLTNKETGKKAGVNSDLIRPRFALMNPELTYSLPKYPAVLRDHRHPDAHSGAVFYPRLAGNETNRRDRGRPDENRDP